MIYLITCDNGEDYEDREQYNVCYFTKREDAEQWLRENDARHEAYVQFHERRRELINEIVVPEEPKPEKPFIPMLNMNHEQHLAYNERKHAYDEECHAIYQRAFEYRRQKIVEIDANLGECPDYSHNAAMQEIELGSLNNTSSRIQ